MANYTVPKGHVGTHEKKLVANVMDVVTFDSVALREAEILTDGAADIYITSGAEGDPVVAGTGSWRIPAYPGATTIQIRDASTKTVIRLISAGTPTYSVSRT